MHWQQITLIAIYTMGLTAHILNNGKPINAKYSFVVYAISKTLMLLLLWSAGFFD